ncbi:hypothetical protein EXIGLDRAFT_484764 [Exidia glandulosa HHB12029]|uniref:Uncharacterized protein n=1 Tax=Exidia glandulosa HHB12029 TaxID=1314781 RepID=A0A165PKH0_EXIGL|nr:hypothetical protein EXIGLDRAFT_484764 [Exidia glandulosa HHB12029]
MHSTGVRDSWGCRVFTSLSSASSSSSLSGTTALTWDHAAEPSQSDPDPDGGHLGFRVFANVPPHARPGCQLALAPSHFRQSLDRDSTFFVPGARPLPASVAAIKAEQLFASWHAPHPRMERRSQIPS